MSYGFFVAAESGIASYSVRVSGDGRNTALLQALNARPGMRLVARGGVGMVPPEGSSQLNDLPIESYSVWVDGMESEDEAKKAVEDLLADIGIPGAIQDARRLSD
jgi:hypothetical protein